MSETVVLVEGYHDRAFWKGLLTHAGCKDKAAAGGMSGVRVVDPSGKPVAGGQYAFESRSGAFIRVVPCNGDDGVVREARIRLQGRATRPISRLVACVDADVDAGKPVEAAAATLAGVVQRLEPTASADATGVIRLEDGTTVATVIWQTPDRPSDLLPVQQCLERLVAAALGECYPDRAVAVREWLQSRPLPPATDPKAHAWSYMAGWYPTLGCEAFLTAVWSDDALASTLRNRLAKTGAWDVIEAIVS